MIKYAEGGAHATAWEDAFASAVNVTRAYDKIRGDILKPRENFWRETSSFCIE